MIFQYFNRRKDSKNMLDMTEWQNFLSEKDKAKSWDGCRF
jgi:hypothetical protein